MMSAIEGMDNLGMSQTERDQALRDDRELALWLERNHPRWSDAYLRKRWGDYPRWRKLLNALPAAPHTQVDLASAVRIHGQKPFSDTEKEILMGLHPWRKGPYEVCGVHIDSEWRSNLKWARLADHLGELGGQRVLDVGGGNGYFSFRLCHHRPDLVVCLEPMGLYWAQYMSIRRYITKIPLMFVPLKLEEFDAPIRFDTVLSLGVLYHSRDPYQHLRHLRDLGQPGGQLILETLVMPEESGSLELVSGQRYAQMNNVWLIPTASQALDWLNAAGFSHPQLIDVTVTTGDEQRSTEWMRFHSLSNFLSPDRPTQTIEGHPAPARALLKAEIPAC